MLPEFLPILTKLPGNGNLETNRLGKTNLSCTPLTSADLVQSDRSPASAFVGVKLRGYSETLQRR